MNINPTWYNDPLKIVDALDIENMGHRAIELLRDLVVSRHTELHTLRKIFNRAMGRPASLISSQQITLELQTQAKQLNITPSRYIADELGISIQAARKRLKTLEHKMIVIDYQNSAKTFPFEEKSSIYTEQSRIKLSDSKTNNIAAGLTFDCPTQAYTKEHFPRANCTGTASARFGICFNCSEIYGKNKAERLERGYRWVNDLIALYRKEAVSDAKNMQFKSTYGVNFDVSEVS